jgi:hypothetical protein
MIRRQAMQTTRFTLLSGLALAVLLTLSFGQGLVFGHDHSKGAQADRIEGVWAVEVTILSACGPTGVPMRTVPAMNMFIHGGMLIETPGTTQVAPPPIGAVRGTPGLGTWQHLGGRHYGAVFTFFRLNPDNTFTGTQKITEDIALSEDADEFTFTGTSEVFDTTGTPLLPIGCNTATATRLE